MLLILLWLYLFERQRNRYRDFPLTFIFHTPTIARAGPSKSQWEKWLPPSISCCYCIHVWTCGKLHSKTELGLKLRYASVECGHPEWCPNCYSKCLLWGQHFCSKLETTLTCICSKIYAFFSLWRRWRERLRSNSLIYFLISCNGQSWSQEQELKQDYHRSSRLNT